MFSILLAIIYLSFISLGLPDSMLGAAWPVMHIELGVPLSAAGILTMIIACGTIVSSIFASRVVSKLGTGLVTAISVGMTAVALLGFAVCHNFYVLCLLAVPYGLGAGGVDAALNNYVALHYSSRHMSWLHAFWGVGVSISPYVMGVCLSLQWGWPSGYASVSVIQFALTAVLFFSLPLWDKGVKGAPQEQVEHKVLTLRQVVKLPGALYVFVAFFAYCAAESTTGLWAASYMVEYRQVAPETAASFGALFYLGITAGRFVNGFASEKFSDRALIRFGVLTLILGVFLVAMPWNALSLAGLLVIGFGCAPIYPCIIHSTPQNFGKENSQALVGLQMASAYVGSMLMPPLFGLIAQHIHMGLYPVYLGIFGVLMLIMTEMLYRPKNIETILN